MFPFLAGDYSEERAVEISSRALEQYIQDYFDECFSSFVLKVIASNDHTTSVEVQSYFGFVVTAWTKVGTLTLQQLKSVSKVFDRNVHNGGIDKKPGAWRQYFFERLRKGWNNANTASVG